MLKSRILCLVVLVVVAVTIGAVLFYLLSFVVVNEDGEENGLNDVVPDGEENGHTNGVTNGGDNVTNSEVSFLFSFENDMQGWEARALDLELANSTIDWSITRSHEQVKDGSSSLRFYLENWNDKGKIWIERSFAVKPNTRYRVNVSYAFASGDWGDVNFFTIIAGVLRDSPKSRDNLVYQGDTGNRASSDVGYLWLEKSYSFLVESDESGKLYVTVGVWGVWETPRTYYLDSLKVVFAEVAS